MKMLKLMVLCLFWVIPLTNFSQVENGGFEDCYPDPVNAPYLIDHAFPWKNLNGTCDFEHTCTAQIGIPRTGVGCGRIGWDYNNDEYCYGKTASLNAGTTYIVSYWIRKMSASQLDFQFGAYISANVPVPMTTNPYVQTVVPQIITPLTSAQYIKVSFCYTPTQTGVHYITFGSFGLNNQPNDNNIETYTCAYLDDVNVEVAGSSNAIANIASTQSEFCPGSSIVLDGTASSGETEYEWNIYDVTNGTEVLKYDGARTDGTAGTINVNTLLGSNLIPGHCYRAYLKVYNGCDNTAHVDFCIVNPNLDFITDGSPLCQNTAATIEVAGQDGWTYTWYQNGTQIQSGVGLKTITSTPTASGQVTYTVNVVTPENCTATGTYTFTVHTANNVAPTMNGINGDANNYTYYVNAGDAVNFTSLISNNAGETVTTTFVGSLPSGFLVTPPPSTQNGGVTTFNWQTNYNSIGSYDIVLKVEDNNACGKMSNIYKFHIIVICDYCPICITYDDRTPSNNPLPPSTKAGQCIEAGVNAPVIIGAGNSKYFQAGQSIDMGAFFDTDGGTYEAVIDPTTCATGCENCCADFSGFTLDLPIPNVITPNGDGTNDVWYVHDDDNPWCAFNATGFELYIVNIYQNVVYHQIRYEGQGCCPFRAPDNWVPSSIFWDGRVNTGLSQGQLVTEGVYFYILYLHGCGQTQVYSGNITVADPQGMMQQSGTPTGTANNQLLTEPQMSATATVDGLPAEHFYVFPNPTAGFVRIKSSQPILKVQVLDANGKVWIEKTTELDQPVDLSQLSSGSYRIRTTLADLKVKENTIVKE